MDGKEFENGTKLSVIPYLPKNERPKKGPVPFNNLFVKNFPREDFAEEDLVVKFSFYYFRNSLNLMEKS